MDISKHYNFYPFVIDALKRSGGSSTNEELIEAIVNLAALTDQQTSLLHGDGPRTEVDYKIAWAKTYLKNAGFLENSARGVWRLTEKAKSEPLPSYEEINRLGRGGQKPPENLSDGASDQVSPQEGDGWVEELTDKLMDLSPSGFEQLCQRLLREKGFSKVEVTGRSGGGGIDGVGTLKLSLLSFRVFFQSKRYRGSVGPSEIRDFRGAMSGRADKGIFLTTGNFTKGARQEANRDGADPVELLDGEDICLLMRELMLRVRKEEVIAIDYDWFDEYL